MIRSIKVFGMLFLPVALMVACGEEEEVSNDNASETDNNSEMEETENPENVEEDNNATDEQNDQSDVTDEHDHHQENEVDNGSEEGFDDSSPEVEEHVEAYYAHLQDRDLEGAVDYLSDYLLERMQMEEDAFVESYGPEHDFEYTIVETELFDDEALHNDHDENQLIRNELEEDTDIYRVRLDVLYVEPGINFPGIDDALVAEIDGEWQILGVYSFQ